MSGASGAGRAAAFWLSLRVYYEDTDAGGVVYYANYLKYLERARTEWLRAAGYEQAEIATQRGLLFVVRAVSIEYRAPGRLDDRLDVSARVERVGRASIDFEHSIECDGAELCEAQVAVACLDAETFRPRVLPADLKGVLAGER